MSRFFDDNFEDEGSRQSHVDHDSGTRYSIPDQGTSGGVSNEYCMNDYRNRMPFHYLENGTDGYYYWTYGATMEIELIFTDVSLAITSEIPQFVIQVNKNGQNATDPTTMIANIEVGSMAEESTDDYYRKQILDDELGAIWHSLNSKTADLYNESQRQRAEVDQHEEELNIINEDLYSEAGPQYLMDRLIQGNNLTITRITEEGQVPKLRLDVEVGADQLLALVSSGLGTQADPFIVTVPAAVFSNLDNTTIAIQFSGLPNEGMEYVVGTLYYIRFSTLSSSLIKTFTIRKYRAISGAPGIIYNKIYYLYGGQLLDTNLEPSTRYFGTQPEIIIKEDIPFIFIRGDRESISINGVSYSTAIYMDVLSSTLQQQELSISVLPQTAPILAKLVSSQGSTYLSLSIGRFSLQSFSNILSTQIIQSDNVSFTNVILSEANWN